MEKEKITLTKSGFEKLELELRNLIDVTRPEVIEELKNARAQGDLSENADYDAARARQAEVEGRISQIEDIIANSRIIEDKATSAKVVGLGTKVTVKDLSNKKEDTYEIVGTVEANPLEGRISNACPLGEALIGKKAGEKVTVKVSNPYEVEILNISVDK